MQIIDICFTTIILPALFISGIYHIDATTESLFVDSELGIIVKIDDNGLIFCSGLICSNQTEYCRIFEMPVGRKKLKLLKQCVDREGMINKEIK